METELLTVRQASDADEQLTRQIRLIYREFDGGLGEFFRTLRRPEADSETRGSEDTNRLIRTRLSQASRTNRGIDRARAD